MANAALVDPPGRAIVGPGDVVSIVTAGGGGYGNPHERERALVEADLIDGKITEQQARRKPTLHDEAKLAPSIARDSDFERCTRRRAESLMVCQRVVQRGGSLSLRDESLHLARDTRRVS